MSLRSWRIAWFAIGLCVVSTTVAWGHAGSGGNCAGCHTTVSGRQNVTSPTTIDAAPGQLVSLTINVTNGGAVDDPFAVAFTGKTLSTTPLSGVGAETLDAVKGTGDPIHDILMVPLNTGTDTWTTRNPAAAPATYFSIGGSSNLWTGSTFSKTYQFTVPIGTPADTYQMEMKASGFDSDINDKWTQATDVFIHVSQVPEPAVFVLLLTAGGAIACAVWRRRRQNG
jgi:hypothetical protein